MKRLRFASRLIAGVLAVGLFGSIASRFLQAADPPAPAKRWTVTAAPFANELQAYGGSAICTPEGDFVGWNGHQNSKTGNCVLLYLKPPEMTLRALTCKNAGPLGVTFPSMVYDTKDKTIWVYGGWPAKKDASYADLYRLHLENIEWEKVGQGKLTPPGRNGAGAIFDAAKDRPDWWPHHDSSWQLLWSRKESKRWRQAHRSARCQLTNAARPSGPSLNRAFEIRDRGGRACREFPWH